MNSSKSNNLPPSQFADKFVEAQHHGLVLCQQKMSDREWIKRTEPYIEDLNLQGQSDLLNLEKLRAAYAGIIPSLTSLANNQGFKVWDPSDALAQYVV